jgi:predicted RNA binding protein YcfA (HicA-like mRNA interferase family)
MAVDDLDALRDQMPELFNDRPLPPNWDDDWLLIPIEDPEFTSSEDAMAVDYQSLDLSTNAPPTGRAPDSELFAFNPEFAIPDLGGRIAFPGAPSVHSPSGYASPPDALAFYLPFHYFHPHWWGIYLILEGAQELAKYLSWLSGGLLAPSDAMTVAQLFLYGHEAFHHIVEAFATRLEVSHRVPLYRTGFEKLFHHGFGTDNCLEEALASAYGYRKVKERAFRKPNNPLKRKQALEALAKYIRACPPGYRTALKFIRETDFIQSRLEFAEHNHNWALPGIPAKGPGLWLSFPHAFSGISRITSRVNYLVHRDSSLAKRHQLHLRYLRYRDLTERLKRLGRCQFVRVGRGGHEIWETPSGHHFPIPRHPGDLRRGTLAKIVKEAGLSLSVSEFVRA